MSHTDPQDDIPCTACETEGSRSRLDDDGLCPDCRTPAGRLVTALAAIGINATANKRGIVRVEGHTFVCEPGEASVPWVISDVAETLDEATEAAADAIAAIVQAPGLRAEREALLSNERTRLIALVREGEWGPQRNGPVTREQYDAVRHSAHQHLLIAQSAMKHVEMRDAVSRAITDGLRSKNDALTADRDTLAARVAALEAHNGRMVALMNKVADAMGAAEHEPTWSDRAITVLDSLPDASDLRDLAGGAS